MATLTATEKAAILVPESPELPLFLLSIDGEIKMRRAVIIGLITLLTSCCQSAWAATGNISLPIQAAKITGSYITTSITNLDVATQGAQIDAGDPNWRLLFDATTDEAAIWQFRMPSNYSSAPILKIGYSMVSATSGTVEFEGAIMCISPGDAADIGTASFASGATVSETVPGTAGYPSEVSITLNDDSCAAGDTVFVYLSTDANDGTNDTATGDREVDHAALLYTGT